MLAPCQELQGRGKPTKQPGDASENRRARMTVQGQSAEPQRSHSSTPLATWICGGGAAVALWVGLLQSMNLVRAWREHVRDEDGEARAGSRLVPESKMVDHAGGRGLA